MTEETDSPAGEDGDEEEQRVRDVDDLVVEAIAQALVKAVPIGERYITFREKQIELLPKGERYLALLPQGARAEALSKRDQQRHQDRKQWITAIVGGLALGAGVAGLFLAPSSWFWPFLASIGALALLPEGVRRYLSMRGILKPPDGKRRDT